MINWFINIVFFFLIDPRSLFILVIPPPYYKIRFLWFDTGNQECLKQILLPWTKQVNSIWRDSLIGFYCVNRKVVYFLTRILTVSGWNDRSDQKSIFITYNSIYINIIKRIITWECSFAKHFFCLLCKYDFLCLILKRKLESLMRAHFKNRQKFGYIIHFNTTFCYLFNLVYEIRLIPEDWCLFHDRDNVILS